MYSIYTCIYCRYCVCIVHACILCTLQYVFIFMHAATLASSFVRLIDDNLLFWTPHPIYIYLDQLWAATVCTCTCLLVYCSVQRMYSTCTQYIQVYIYSVHVCTGFKCIVQVSCVPLPININYIFFFLGLFTQATVITC